MSIKRLLELNFFNEQTQQWEEGAYKTVAAAVATKDGSNVQAKLDALPGMIEASTDAVKSAVVAEVTGDAPETGNTLGKLHSTIESIKELLNVDDPLLDTFQEIVDYIKEHGNELDQIGTGKVNYSDIVNSLDVISTVEKKVLDARQGKVLKEAIDELKTSLEGLEARADGFASKDQLSALESTVQGQMETLETATRPVISSAPPVNPVDGQMWFKLAGTIEA